MEKTKTEVKNRKTINSIIDSHKRTAICLLAAARFYMQAAWFQRKGEHKKALASTLSGQKEISEANEVQGECLPMPA